MNQLKEDWILSKSGNPYIKCDDFTATIFNDKRNPKYFNLCFYKDKSYYIRLLSLNVEDAKMEARAVLQKMLEKQAY